MAPWAPMVPLPRGPRIHALALAGCVLLLWMPPALGQEDYPDGLPDWIPSAGGGIGFFSRDVDGLSDGIIESGNLVAENCDDKGFCTFFDSDTRAVDGASIPVSGQLLGPAWESAWGKPRLLVHGGYGFPLKDRVVSETGFAPSDFDSNGQNADARVRLTGEPEHFWWAGAGVALQLPVDRYPVWVKLSVSYMEEETNVVGRVDQKIGTDPDNNNAPVSDFRKEEDTLKIRHIAPAFGLEALFARIGPVALGLSGDFMLGIPIGSTDTKLVVLAPGLGVDKPPGESTGGAVTFRYDGDSPWFWGGLTVRLVWVGFDD